MTVTAALLQLLLLKVVADSTVSHLQPPPDPALLRDVPIAGTDLQYLDSSSWQLSRSSNGGASLSATVPGDVITDLQRASLVGDPWFENNFRNSSAWDRDWTYSRTFNDDSDSGSADDQRLLVLDGVKMGAKVALNGRHLGVVSDQFLRYVYHLAPGALRAAGNVLTVSFERSINTHGRFMGCTGGWDWAPMSTTTTPSFGETGAPSPTFSLGIWKSVYLVSVPAGGAAITHVVPHVFYTGSHPVAPLAAGHHADFDVEVAIHLLASPSLKGTAHVVGSWGDAAKQNVLPKPVATAASGAAPLQLVESVQRLKLKATAKQVELWWPNGMGKQPLYLLNVSFVPENSTNAATTTAARRIGFREFAYVTVNDTDPAIVAASSASKVEGSGNHTAAWRVNGAIVFARGANVVPMEELEGRTSSAAIRAMMVSAAAGRMNTLRIWAGAIYFQRPFYEAADELGLVRS